MAYNRGSNRAKASRRSHDRARQRSIAVPTSKETRGPGLAMLVPIYITAVVAIAGVGVPAFFSAMAQNTNSESLRAEQFSRSLDQLGSSNMDIRIGAIYAVGLLIDRDPGYQRPGCEILGAYLGQHSITEDERVEESSSWSSSGARFGYAPAVKPDIKTAFKTLGNHCKPSPKHPDLAPLSAPNVRFRNAYFKSIDASGANFRGAYLGEVNLQGSDLLECDFTDASLEGAKLSGADFSGSDLIGANLIKAEMQSTVLHDVDFDGAYLLGANLEGAKMSGVDLRSIVLSGTLLSGADLSYADLSETTLVAGHSVGGGGGPATGKNVECEGTVWPPDYRPLEQFTKNGVQYCTLGVNN